MSEPREGARPIALAVSVGLAAAMWWAPVSMDPAARHALAVGTFMIAAWISRALDPAVAGLLGCYAMWALGVVPLPVAFSGFVDSATWFVFAASLLGAAAGRSTLPRRLALSILALTGISYSRVLMALIAVDLILTLFVPSGIARVMILAPVAIGLIDVFDPSGSGRLGRGLFVAMVYASTLFDKMILGGAAAITARSAMERAGLTDVFWSRWALACAPAAVLTVLAVWWLTQRLFPVDRPVLADASWPKDALHAMGPWTATDTRVAVLLSAALLLWATDAAHHVSPAVVAMGGGLAALLPGIGVLRVEDLKRLNYLPLLFVASAIGLGNVLVSTGAIAGVTAVMTQVLAPAVHDVRWGSVTLYGAACLYHLVIGNEVAMVATSMPAMMQFARAQHLDPFAVGVIWTLGSGGKLFLYQSTVLIVGQTYGYFDHRDLLRIGVWLTIAEAGVVLLLTMLYWPMVGIG